MRTPPLATSPQTAGLSGRSRIATTLVGPEVRAAMIAEAAYFRAQRRGFAPGHELEDWLTAEAEIDTALAIGVLGN